jgi:hypothetical protein
MVIAQYVNDVTYSVNNVTDRRSSDHTFDDEILVHLQSLNFIIMKSLFYIVALVLILIWSIGFLGYGIGGGFHMILVLALLSAAMRVILEKKYTHKYSA